MVKLADEVFPSCTATSLRREGSLLNPVEVAQTSYVPAARLSVRYWPWLSVKTIISILVFTFCARTNAARNGAPSSPLTIPEMSPPGEASAEVASRSAKNAVQRIFFIAISTDKVMRPSCALARVYRKAARRDLDSGLWVVTQFGSRWSKRMSALKTGGLYKTCYQQGRGVL